MDEHGPVLLATTIPCIVICVLGSIFSCQYLRKKPGIFGNGVVISWTTTTGSVILSSIRPFTHICYRTNIRDVIPTLDRCGTLAYINVVERIIQDVGLGAFSCCIIFLSGKILQNVTIGKIQITPKFLLTLQTALIGLFILRSVLYTVAVFIPESNAPNLHYSQKLIYNIAYGYGVISALAVAVPSLRYIVSLKRSISLARTSTSPQTTINYCYISILMFFLTLLTYAMIVTAVPLVYPLSSVLPIVVQTSCLTSMGAFLINMMSLVKFNQNQQAKNSRSGKTSTGDDNSGMFTRIGRKLSVTIMDPIIRKGSQSQSPNVGNTTTVGGNSGPTATKSSSNKEVSAPLPPHAERSTEEL
ncbi:hypothetical protein BKA69DRAFT_1038022 [Paraphysoderma sedebokerense]|nr:hypothetical protein BKA69DRAFT_1038022 [Paraphysoderma sedebokerense]